MKLDKDALDKLVSSKVAVLMRRDSKGGMLTKEQEVRVALESMYFAGMSAGQRKEHGKLKSMLNILVDGFGRT